MDENNLAPQHHTYTLIVRHVLSCESYVLLDGDDDAERPHSAHPQQLLPIRRPANHWGVDLPPVLQAPERSAYPRLLLEDLGEFFAGVEGPGCFVGEYPEAAGLLQCVALQVGFWSNVETQG